MGLRNTTERYGSAMKFFHWTLSILIIGMLLLGLVISQVHSRHLAGSLITWHKSIGLTILGLMVLRTIWRLSSKRPRLPASIPVWQKRLAEGLHFVLYLVIFSILLSGWIMSGAGGHKTQFFGLFDATFPISKNVPLEALGGKIHELLAWVITGLLVLHIVGALKHHFVDKDGVLRNMLPFSK